MTITGRAALTASEMPVRLAEEREAAIAEGAVRDGEAHAGGAAHRRRPRRSTAEWLGTRPDRIAAWAVALGFLLVVAGILSAH